MHTEDRLSAEEVERRDALVGRLFQSMIGGAELLTIYVGDRLGLYRALTDGGPATPRELAARTTTHERYAREWLEQQAVAGILDVDDVNADENARRYSLSPAHAEVLLDQDSLNYLAPVGRFLVATALPMATLLKAFREGGGVSWTDYGEDAREGQAAFNRPAFLNLLGREWLPSIPDVHARLQADPPARVADIGCGGGWSSIGIAQAYPKVRVDGFDVDEPTIALARANATEAGLADRVSFQVRDAGDTALEGRYDLVLAFEMVHDLSRPVEVLRSMRKLAAESGAVIVVDERVGERFTAPSDEIERLMYTFSVLCCLPAGMSEQPSAGTGTVMRPATLRRYATEAGFRDVEILPIEHDMFRFYRLVA
jgi:2-polyprenyl-3-methyl-5-hydroxy-6-metoxy-1,4-benzoquinol methylase